ncbi:hypothetical protein Q3G72_017827 [Acer saccharum]|nr:hypothetical protein Q3G72_010138 [Acer saccharum]KAK1548451.1 hypothetical protein Q3G72_017827 [Acer saccharum]
MTRSLDDGTDRMSWLEARQGRITATMASKIHRGGASARREVIEESFQPPVEITGNRYIDRGHEREPVIAAWIAKKWPGLIGNTHLFHAAGNRKHAATPDGVGLSPQGTLTVAEIKTSKYDRSPDSPFFFLTGYREQMQWQMYVTGAEQTLFVWEQHDDDWDTGPTPLYEEPRYAWVLRDQELIDELIVDAELALAERDAFAASVEPAEEGDAELALLAAEVLEARKVKATAEAALKAPWTRMNSMLTERTEFSRPIGRALVTWSSRTEETWQPDIEAALSAPVQGVDGIEDGVTGADLHAELERAQQVWEAHLLQHQKKVEKTVQKLTLQDSRGQVQRGRAGGRLILGGDDVVPHRDHAGDGVRADRAGPGLVDPVPRHDHVGGLDHLHARVVRVPAGAAVAADGDVQCRVRGVRAVVPAHQQVVRLAAADDVVDDRDAVDRVSAVGRVDADRGVVRVAVAVVGVRVLDRVLRHQDVVAAPRAAHVRLRGDVDATLLRGVDHVRGHDALEDADEHHAAGVAVLDRVAGEDRAAVRADRHARVGLVPDRGHRVVAAGLQVVARRSDVEARTGDLQVVVRDRRRGSRGEGDLRGADVRRDRCHERRPTGARTVEADRGADVAGAEVQRRRRERGRPGADRGVVRALPERAVDADPVRDAAVDHAGGDRDAARPGDADADGVDHPDPHRHDQRVRAVEDREAVGVVLSGPGGLVREVPTEHLHMRAAGQPHDRRGVPRRGAGDRGPVRLDSDLQLVDDRDGVGDEVGLAGREVQHPAGRQCRDRGANRHDVVGDPVALRTVRVHGVDPGGACRTAGTGGGDCGVDAVASVVVGEGDSRVRAGGEQRSCSVPRLLVGVRAAAAADRDSRGAVGERHAAGVADARQPASVVRAAQHHRTAQHERVRVRERAGLRQLHRVGVDGLHVRRQIQAGRVHRNLERIS